MEPTNFRDPSRWNTVIVPARVAARAYERVDVNEAGCWISQYSVASHGYSQIGWQDNRSRHVVLGHRAAWTHVNGQVPVGMTIDHLCKERRCVNPEHLRLLSNRDNARRIDGRDWPIGFCANGHPDSLGRPTWAKDKRGNRRPSTMCSVCKVIYQQRYEWNVENPGAPMPTELLLASEKPA